jgi:hypothetical protein
VYLTVYDEQPTTTATAVYLDSAEKSVNKHLAPLLPSRSSSQFGKNRSIYVYNSRWLINFRRRGGRNEKGQSTFKQTTASWLYKRCGWIEWHGQTEKDPTERARERTGFSE